VDDLDGFDGQPDPEHGLTEDSGPAAAESTPAVPRAVWDSTELLHSPLTIPFDQGPSGPRPTKRPQKRLLVVGLAMVIIVAAVVVGVVSTNSNTNVPGAGVAPAAFVVSSTRDTLAQHSADVAISGLFSVDGHTLPMTGSGLADFDTNAFSATVSMTANAHSIVEKELVAGGKLLIGISYDGSNVPQLLTGADWVDIPLPDQDSSSLGAGNVDPLTQLQMMEKKGATVVPLGTSSVGGVTVSGFDVTPSLQEETQAIQGEVSSGQLTQSEANQILQEKGRIGNLTLGLYFDANGLMRRETFDLGGGSSGATGKMTMDFQNYGTPVTITLPPTSDIVGYTTFLQKSQAAAAGNSGV
jgi:hypothetical protein